MDVKKHVLDVSEDEAADVKKARVDDEMNVNVIPSREERLEMLKTTFRNRKELEDDDVDLDIRPDGTHPMTFEDIANFHLDMYETQGFDVQDYSLVDDAGLVLQLYDPPKVTRGESCLPELTECADEAIQDYNRQNGKQFGEVVVVKANSEPACACPYRFYFYITFKATDETEKITETFQAKVDVCIPTTKRVVRFVRIQQPPRLFSLPCRG
ncbi:hypothetical protein ACET3Z_008064 [Daucus carota]